MILHILNGIRHLLVFCIWVGIILFIFGIGLQIHLAGEIAEYKEVYNIANKVHKGEDYCHVLEAAIVYNAWLSYWREIDRVPVIEFFVPDKIRKLDFIRPELDPNNITQFDNKSFKLKKNIHIDKKRTKKGL